MTPLDEMRALGEAYKDWAGETGQLARAVLAMTPVVEAAMEVYRDDGFTPFASERDTLIKAVAAFRAANREGETKAT